MRFHLLKQKKFRWKSALKILQLSSSKFTTPTTRNTFTLQSRSDSNQIVILETCRFSKRVIWITTKNFPNFILPPQPENRGENKLSKANLQLNEICISKRNKNPYFHRDAVSSISFHSEFFISCLLHISMKHEFKFSPRTRTFSGKLFFSSLLFSTCKIFYS